VTWLVKGKGKNLNQKYVRATMTDLVSKRKLANENGKESPEPVSVTSAWLPNVKCL